MGDSYYVIFESPQVGDISRVSRWRIPRGLYMQAKRSMKVMP